LSSYWEKVLDQRIARRRALIGTGGLASAAALLAACGGGSGSGGNSSGAKAGGITTDTVDETKSAKVGGVIKSNIDSDPQSFDPMFTDIGGAQRNARMQSRLFEVKPGINAASTGEVIGDLADSWEFSPDKLQLTVKLVKNAHFDPRSPTNGRVVTAQDVVWSWNRFTQVGTLVADYYNGVNPGAPIVSMAATDDNTVVIKMSEPQAGVLTQLTGSSAGTFLVMPVEAEDKYDPRRDVRSAGPYNLLKHEPSVGSTYKKNPGFHRAYGYADTIELPIVTENATGLAAFKAGQIYKRSSFSSQDILPAKKDVPQLELRVADMAANTVRIMYGWADDPLSQFRDVRVRQALSYAQDRDLFIEGVYNVSAFKNEGIPLDTAWSTAVNATDTTWWLNPQSKEFGENAKYYNHDPAEAKKLLAAAGFANGLDIVAHYITTAQYGVDFQKWIEIVLGFGNDVGFRWKNEAPGYTQDWRPKYADAKGRYSGVAFRIDTGPPDTGDRLYSHYHSKGTLFQGFSADGKSSFAGDPKMDDLTLQTRREFDQKKRIQIGYDIQRYEAQQQYFPFAPGGASALTLTWPVLRNVGVYKGGRDELVYLWVDDTKPPLKS